MPDFGPLISFLGWTAMIAVPLAAWKAVEIMLWAVSHVSIH